MYPKLQEAYKRRYGVALLNPELAECLGSKSVVKTSVAAFQTCAVPNLFKCTLGATGATKVELKPVCLVVADGGDSAGVHGAKLPRKG